MRWASLMSCHRLSSNSPPLRQGRLIWSTMLNASMTRAMTSISCTDLSDLVMSFDLIQRSWSVTGVKLLLLKPFKISKVVDGPSSCNPPPGISTCDMAATASEKSLRRTPWGSNFRGKTLRSLAAKDPTSLSLIFLMARPDWLPGTGMSAFSPPRATCPGGSWLPFGMTTSPAEYGGIFSRDTQTSSATITGAGTPPAIGGAGGATMPIAALRPAA